MLAGWLDQAIDAFTRLMPDYSFFNFAWNVRGLLAILLVSVVCGAVGSLVVGKRMAFFSDALAHCAFAGISLGFLIALGAGVRQTEDFYSWILPIMVVFGILMGLLIHAVRQSTALANDTVIAVFFAGAVGLGAILLPFASRRRYFNPETFLFGDPLLASSQDIINLFLLTVITGAVLAWMYNELVFTSFNQSLALSRKVRVRLCNLVFIILLAMIVNLSLLTVGVLLINAVLIVPAATAANLCRNMRQLFWCTIALCLFVGVSGMGLSWTISLIDTAGGASERVSFGVGGIMVVLSVVLFGLSVFIGPILRQSAKPQARPTPPNHPTT